MTAPLPALLAKIVSPEQGGFLTLTDIRALAALDPKRQILIRCAACRMVVSADSVEHVCNIMNAADSGADYVRDVSLLSYDPAFAPEPKPAPPLPKRPQPARRVESWCYVDTDTYDCHSDADPGL